MKRYTIRGYDANHNELWITIGTSFVGAEACRRTDSVIDIINICELVKTGKIIDPETGLPVIRHRDPVTGQRTQGSRYVAYFRIYCEEVIWEVFFTRHGRKAGVRNHEGRRDDDDRTALISGHPPIHTGPRIVNTGYGHELIIGEGDPHGTRGGSQNIDRWGDPVVHIATCYRVTKGESDNGWWGYTYYNYYTRDNCPLDRATIADVRRHLHAIAEEMIAQRGSDIASW